MSERKLVTVRKVSSITPILGADNIELAYIDGWRVVCRKGEFKENDCGVYFEVDSFVPTLDPRFSFLEKNAKDWEGKHGAVIKTMRLRKELSQGLLLPLDLFPEINYKPEFDVDYSEDIGVYKYDKEPDAPIEEKGTPFHRFVIKHLPRSWRKKLFGAYRYFFPGKERVGKEGRRRSTLPGYLLVSNEERIQNLFNKHDFISRKNSLFEVTIKLDGSAAYYYVKDGIFGLASRGQKRGLESGDHFAYIAKKYNLEHYLPMLNRNLQFLGELMGPGIQGNREKLEDFEYFVYNIYDIDARKKLGKVEREEILAKLAEVGCTLKSVPFLEVTTLERFITIEELLNYAEGKSLNNSVREGVVFKTLDGEFSFKVISNRFLLGQKD